MFSFLFIHLRIFNSLSNFLSRFAHRGFPETRDNASFLAFCVSLSLSLFFKLIDFPQGREKRGGKGSFHVRSPYSIDELWNAHTSHNPGACHRSVCAKTGYTSSATVRVLYDINYRSLWSPIYSWRNSTPKELQNRLTQYNTKCYYHFYYVAVHWNYKRPLF